MKPQAIRRPLWLLRLMQASRRARPVLADAVPRTPADAAAFIVYSALWLVGLVLAGHTLGVLR